MRRLAHRWLVLLSLATGAASLCALSQNPFAWPVVERTGADLHLALDRVLARALPPEAVFHRLGQAVTEGDRDQAGMFAALALRQGVTLPPALAEAAAELADGPDMLRQAADCGA